MSLEFGSGDFLAVTNRAWNLYRHCYVVARDSPPEFQLLLQEIAALSQSFNLLHHEAKDPDSILLRTGIDNPMNGPMRRVMETFTELEELIPRYEKLGDVTGWSKIWGKLRRPAEAASVETLRNKLIYHNGVISLLLSSASSSSLQRIKESNMRLERRLAEIGNPTQQINGRTSPEAATVSTPDNTGAELRVFRGDEEISITGTKLDRYKLITEFCDGSVTHSTYKTNLATGERRIPVLTKWTDQKILGSGGFGTVVLQQAEGGQLRAVKKLLKGFGKVDYSRELRALAKVTQRQDLFVQLLGWYENSDIVFIAMEYIEHGDLSQYLKITGPCTDEDAREITRQLLDGLVVLHEIKICHRDLKPQNVLIASLQPIWVKIADFGVSKYTKGTNLYTRTGTRGYIAPELLGLLPCMTSSNVYSNAVDMWALGCIVHEVLTMEIPFMEARYLDSRFSGLDHDGELEDEAMPETDMSAVKAFCEGLTEFPTECLRRSGVSCTAIEFVKTLLVAEPGKRVTGKEALQSEWVCSGLPRTA